VRRFGASLVALSVLVASVAGFASAVTRRRFAGVASWISSMFCCFLFLEIMRDH
jgi:hypothetical protein